MHIHVSFERLDVWYALRTVIGEVHSEHWTGEVLFPPPPTDLLIWWFEWIIEKCGGPQCRIQGEAQQARAPLKIGSTIIFVSIFYIYQSA